MYIENILLHMGDISHVQLDFQLLIWYSSDCKGSHVETQEESIDWKLKLHA